MKSMPVIEGKLLLAIIYADLILDGILLVLNIRAYLINLQIK